jgi:hypothetical protein
MSGLFWLISGSGGIPQLSYGTDSKLGFQYTTSVSYASPIHTGVGQNKVATAKEESCLNFGSPSMQDLLADNGTGCNKQLPTNTTKTQ